MKKCVNGEFIEMTPEEVAAINETISAMPPTYEERVAALEAGLLELAEVIANG